MLLCSYCMLCGSVPTLLCSYAALLLCYSVAMLAYCTVCYSVCCSVCYLVGCCRELRCVPDIWSLVEWSDWLTPENLHRRYDTVFYLCCTEEKQEPSADHEEISSTQVCALFCCYMRSILCVGLALLCVYVCVVCVCMVPGCCV